MMDEELDVGAFGAAVIFGFFEGLGIGAPWQHWRVTSPNLSQKYLVQHLRSLSQKLRNEKWKKDSRKEQASQLPLKIVLLCK